MQSSRNEVRAAPARLEPIWSQVRKMNVSRLFGLAGALCIAVPLATPSNAADAESGKRLAERWCVSCHIVDASQKSATTDAPPFAVVAKKPDFNVGALALFLLDPHPKMPDIGLSRAAAADLAAFIASQR